MMPAGIAVGTVSAALVASCTGEGPPRPKCEDFAAFDAGLDVQPYTEIASDAQPPEAFGQETDYGPQCINCTQDRDVEVMTVVDFENGFAPAWFNYGEPGIFLEPPAAGPVPTDAGTTINVPPPYWGLQVASLADKPGGTRCGSNYALHMAGDRFSSWGGGFVTRLVTVRGEELIEKYCDEGASESFAASVAAADPAINGIGGTPRYMTNGSASGEMVMKDQASGCFFYMSPGADQPSLLGLDVSAYEGISFWARRGPNGQSTLRVALVDQDTSEDYALQLEREYWRDVDEAEGVPGNPNTVVDPDKAGAACTRVKGCCRHCYENLEFQEWIAPDRSETGAEEVRPSTQDRCWVEGEALPVFKKGIKPPATAEVYYGWDFRNPSCGPTPTTDDIVSACWFQPAQEIWDQWNRDHALCCPRTMEEEKADDVEANGDPRYGGKRCRPYVFNYDQSSGNYCYSAGEVLPEKNQNRCGEGFEAAVVVDTEWKLFRIPWRELRRFTPDKPPINPRGIWMMSFYFSSGYLDTYIDDIGFYRRRK